MDFTIRPDQAVGAEVRRVLDDQLESALVQLRDPGDGGSANAVHEARKSCKRLRAVFRLIRPAISASRYHTLNAAVRDAARELSPARDAQALVAMFDDLLTVHAADPADGDLAAVRAALTDRADLVDQEEESGGPMIRAVERLELVRDVTGQMRIAGRGYGVVGRGLGATYADGRDTFRRFKRKRFPELSHDWRKSVKYSWHHVQLLESTAPSLLAPTADGLHQVSDALGDAHNLTVLIERLREAPARFGGPPTADRIVQMATESRADLEDRAVRLGMRLYADTPKAFGRRMHAFWRASQAGAQLPTGELADLAGAP